MHCRCGWRPMCRLTEGAARKPAASRGRRSVHGLDSASSVHTVRRRLSNRIAAKPCSALRISREPAPFKSDSFAGRPGACTPGNRDTFYGTREEGHALEECGKSPEAARLDSAPSACVSAWECMGDKRSTVPISGCSNIPFLKGRDNNFCCEQSRSTSFCCR